MSEASVTPDLVAQITDLGRQVYELTRRRIPQGSPVGGGSSGGGDPLLFLTTESGTAHAGDRALIRFGTANPTTYGAQFIEAYDKNGDGNAVPYFTNYFEYAAYPEGVALNMVNASGEQRFYSTDLGGGDFLSGLTADGVNSGDGTKFAAVEFDGRTDDGAFFSASSHSGANSAQAQVALRYDDTFSWTVEDQAGVAWYFGSTGGVANAKFGVFDRGASPAAQHAAIDMSAETAAVQAIYDAMAAYGWFAP